MMGCSCSARGSPFTSVDVKPTSIVLLVPPLNVAVHRVEVRHAKADVHPLWFGGHALVIIVGKLIFN